MEQTPFEIILAGEKLRIHAGNARHAHRYLWHSSRHCHGEYELHILLSGQARVEVGAQSCALCAHTGILIAPGQYHRPRADQGALERFSLLFSLPEGRLLETLRREVPACQVFSVPEQLCRVCSDFFYETEAANPYKQEIRQALLTQLLVGLLRQLRVAQVFPHPGAAMTQIERMASIDDFFEKNFAGSAGQTQLAQRLHLSKRQLARVLEKDYGMSYREKLICARMDHAAWLLRTTKLPIVRIAEQVGYGSESAFYQVFRRKFQMTPQHYRSENQSL